MALRPPSRGFSVSRHLSERARAAKAAAAARSDAARAAQQSAGDDPDIAGIGGIAGMVGALRGLVEQFATAARSQAEAHGEQTQEADPASDGSRHTVTLGDGKTRMVFGYTLRMGRDGISAEPFGNTPVDGASKTSDKSAGTAPAALLPIVDVFEDGDAVVVVAELPGADPDRIVCRADGLRLLIEATGVRQYRKDLALPAAVRSDGIVQSFRNGILEVRLVRADPA